jgi:fructose-1,6-bisphosphatase/inositol monophosphatase family enzyme
MERWRSIHEWQPIRVSPRKELVDSLLATGFPYDDFGYETEYMDLLRELMHRTRGIRRLGSAAADLAYVACGRFEAFYEYGLNSWDVAAGVLLCARPVVGERVRTQQGSGVRRGDRGQQPRDPRRIAGGDRTQLAAAGLRV